MKIFFCLCILALAAFAGSSPVKPSPETELENTPVSETAEVKRNGFIPVELGAPPKTRYTSYYVYSGEGTAQHVNPIYIRHRPLYEAYIPRVPGECLCPEGVNHPSDVIYIADNIQYENLAINSTSGELCDGKGNECVDLGTTTDGLRCGQDVVIVDGEYRCLVAQYIISDNKIYSEYKSTHPTSCICKRKTVSMGTIAYAGEVVGDHKDYFSFMIFNSSTDSYYSAPFYCTGDNANVMTRSTLSGIGIVSFTFHAGINHATIECAGVVQIRNEIAPFGFNSFKQHEYKTCECSGNAVSEQYPFLHQVFPKCTATGDCICQPGWAGPKCQHCVAEGTMLGCHHTNWALWVIIACTFLTIVLGGILLAFVCTRKVYQKLKNE